MRDPAGIAATFRDEWPRVVATLMRDFGDLDLAQDMAQEAFAEAAKRWPVEGRPLKPGAWLTTTARRRAIDDRRRLRRFEDRLPQLADDLERPSPEPNELIDDQLALVLGCCHPALSVDAQVALTLRSVAGLSTTQIARSFLVSTDTMTRRLTRAKTKIRSAHIPFVVPDRDALITRLGAVCDVIHLIFTEGHSSATETSLVRGDLCDEATWLAELVATLVPDAPEVRGLVALLLFTNARRSTRVDEHGSFVPLADHDRSLWDRAAIERGREHLAAAHAHTMPGRFQFMAAIAALHATAPSLADTDWTTIVKLYTALYRRDPSPIVALNQAVAISYADGPQAGLAALDLIDSKTLDSYAYFYSARAELLVRTGRGHDALEAFEAALGVTTNPTERAYLQGRRASVAQRASIDHLADRDESE